jgi:site-specific recombinase XerD
VAGGIGLQNWKASPRATAIKRSEPRAALSALVEEFTDELKSQGRSLATVSAYLSDLRGLMGGIGDSLHDFDLANVKTFLQVWATRHRPRSTARRVSCYRQFARFLCERGYLNRNPLEFLRPGIWRGRQEQVLSDNVGLDNKEVNQLLQECDRNTIMGKRDYALLMLMLGTGARVSDVVNLDLDALELSPKRCRVTYRRRKGGRFSVYNLVGPYRQALEHYLAHRLKATGYRPPGGTADRRRPVARSADPVFLSRLGRRMTRQTLFARVKELVTSSRIPPARKPKISPHSLRHTYVSRLWEQEKDIALVAQAAGHASPTVTLNVYTHIARERTEAAITRMQEDNP